MKRLLLLPAFLVILIAFGLAAQLAGSLPRMIQTDTGLTRMLVAGQNGPVIVLDTFGEMASDFWGTIQWRLARFGRVVTYDHRGMGGSDPGPRPRNAQQIATELHDTLRAAKLDPPYLLVGYSFGGPYLRVFADLYPEEVSGLVLIDPSQEEFFDWLKEHRPELNRIPAARLAAQDELGCTWPSLEQARAARLPNVPLTLITALKPFGEHDARLRPQWLACHQRWLSRIPGAQHIVTYRNDHGIIWQDPDLVVETVRQMVNRVETISAARRAGK